MYFRLTYEGVMVMAKKKMKFYEEMEFDDVRYAVDVVNEYSRKMDKVERGFFIAIMATMVNIVSIVGPENGMLSFQLANILGWVGIVGAIASYALGGGILTALRWAWRIGVFFWYIFVFPLDLMAFIMGFGFALVGFLAAPVIFVYMNYRQVKMNYQAAKKYLSYFKAKNPQSNPQANNRISTQTGVRTNSQSVTRTGTQTGTRTYTQTTSRPSTQVGT